jgi:Prolipoprotein diacylglyceryl transferase
MTTMNDVAQRTEILKSTNRQHWFGNQVTLALSSAWRHVCGVILDLLRPRVTLGRRRSPSFKVCGYTGFALALAQSVLLVNLVGLSQLTLLGITAVSVATFFTLAMVTKIVAGEELLIYYHQEIAVLVLAALFLQVTHQPVLAYLDIEALGIGAFLACGRVGCLLVGCCHGRPCRWGTKYKEEHARAGFPPDLVGVRLFPIQIVESVMVACLVICGVILLLSRRHQGEAFVFYLVTYGAGRFILEFLRGDRGRAYLWGFSEAQWTSLLIASALVFAERVELLPCARWHWLIPASMAASMATLTIWRPFDRTGKHELRHPHHLGEIISALDHLERSQHLVHPSWTSSSSVMVHVAQTSHGYQFSLGELRSQGRSIRHYSVSKVDGSLSLSVAQTLARFIAQLRPDSDHCTILAGHTGVFHILFESQAGALSLEDFLAFRRSEPMESQPPLLSLKSVLIELHNVVVVNGGFGAAFARFFVMYPASGLVESTRPDREVEGLTQRPVQTGASHAMGLAGSAPGASPPPAFHTRTKKYLLVGSVTVGDQVTL